MLTHVLVTCVCKDYNRKVGQGWNDSLPFDKVDFALFGESVACSEMIDDQDNQIRNGGEGKYRGVLETIQTTEEREWDHHQPGECVSIPDSPPSGRGLVTSSSRRDKSSEEGSNIHKSSDPEPPLEQISRRIPRIRHQPLHDSRHQVPNNNQIADPDTKTLDRNSRIKHHGSIRISNLTQGEETTPAAIQVTRTAGLEVETETGSQPRPADDEDAEGDAHIGHGVGHG